MQLTETQKKMLRALLGQLMTTYTINEEELSATYVYLFGEQPIAPFFTDKELFETVIYLRETAETYQLMNLEALIQYYEAKKKKMRNFMTDIAADPQAPAAGKLKGIGGAIRLQFADSQGHDIVQIDTLAQQVGKDTRQLFEEIYANVSRCFESLPLLTKGEHDIHAAVRKHVQGLLKANKPVTIHYRFSTEEHVSLSLKNYLEQFSSHRKGEQVFIMQFKKQVGKWFQMLVCEQNDAKMFGWISSMKAHFERNQPPDYGDIIDVIRKEKPITDNGFKLRLTEWLIYSKLMISHCHSGQQMAVSAIPFVPSCGHFFRNSDVRYYGGWGMHYWIHELFESKLSFKKWIILKRPQGHAWLTSDNPGFMININELEAGMHHLLPKHSLLEIRRDSILYYPLSKDYCLRVQPNVLYSNEVGDNSSIEYQESSEGELNFVNGVTVSTHKEVVIASQKKTLKQIQSTYMAKNGKVGDSHRDGQVTDRSQTHNPKNDKWVKRDTETGRFIDQKADDKPFKGVRKEK